VTIGLIYIGVLIVGVVYAFASGFLGWLADLGDGDVHVDTSGHLDAGHPHPISGTTVATFITGFGGGGIVGHYLLQWSVVGGLLLAAASGLALAGAAYLVLELIFKQTQAGAEFDLGSLVGREAEVITSIPEGGTGEVAYLVKGQRDRCAARSADGRAVARGRVVVIDRVMGSTLYVRLKSG
jgi:membrane-bound ClpP family serine protease